MQNPPDRLPPLDLLVSFEAAARHLSFTRAGAERFITQSAMSRQIQALEQQLGVPLFRRRHRSLSLTDHGLKLHATCAAVLEQLRSTIGGIRAPARREVLSLTTTPGLAALWLIPRLPMFTRDHPGIDVRLDAGFELRDLRADGFDLAIRYSRVGSGDGTPMFAESMLPVCSPKLLREGPPLKTPQDLRHHTVLQVTGGPGMPLEWDPWFKSVGLDGPAAGIDAQLLALQRSDRRRAGGSGRGHRAAATGGCTAQEWQAEGAVQGLSRHHAGLRRRRQPGIEGPARGAGARRLAVVAGACARIGSAEDDMGADDGDDASAEHAGGARHHTSTHKAGSNSGFSLTPAFA